MTDLLATGEGSAPTLEEIKRWPATVPLPRACAAFGISKSYGYELAARGEFPARLIKRGRLIRVVTSSVVAVLDVDPR